MSRNSSLEASEEGLQVQGKRGLIKGVYFDFGGYLGFTTAMTESIRCIDRQDGIIEKYDYAEKVELKLID